MVELLALCCLDPVGLVAAAPVAEMDADRTVVVTGDLTAGQTGTLDVEPSLVGVFDDREIAVVLEVEWWQLERPDIATATGGEGLEVLGMLRRKAAPAQFGAENVLVGIG